MDYIKRQLSDTLLQRMKQYPVVSLTGPRQSGKSTLLKKLLPDYRYITLEDPDMRLLATEDPRGFLKNFANRCVIDEAQNVPQLFSYIQGIVDRENEPGMFVLSGSQNFLLMEKISQSLSGRTGILRLYPFSHHELHAAGKGSMTTDEWLFRGGYPRIYDMNIPPEVYYPDYTQTYLEKDVRSLHHIGDQNAFTRFMKICACHVGQIMNYSALANECDINVKTLKSWLSVLEASHVIFFLRPYHRNLGKRVAKSPKLYYCDTGLACSLLGIASADQLDLHYLRGALFENMVIAEYMKQLFNTGVLPQIYYWRDSNRNEVDLVIEDGGRLKAVEIKATATTNYHLFREMRAFTDAAGIPPQDTFIAYNGDGIYQTEKGAFCNWADLVTAVQATNPK
jgi:predicted AAA+ superfamily ATPase